MDINLKCLADGCGFKGIAAIKSEKTKLSDFVESKAWENSFFCCIVDGEKTFAQVGLSVNEVNKIINALNAIITSVTEDAMNACFSKMVPTLQQQQDTYEKRLMDDAVTRLRNSLRLIDIGNEE